MCYVQMQISSISSSVQSRTIGINQAISVELRRVSILMQLPCPENKCQRKIIRLCHACCASAMCSRYFLKVSRSHDSCKQTQTLTSKIHVWIEGLRRLLFQHKSRYLHVRALMRGCRDERCKSWKWGVTWWTLDPWIRWRFQPRSLLWKEHEETKMKIGDQS